MTENMIDLEKLILEQAQKVNNQITEDEELDELDESSQLDEEIETGSILDKKTVKCKKCLEVGTWTSRGKFPNGTKKWRDHNSLICNGRICGTCNQSRAKDTMQKTRSKEDHFYKD